MRRRIDLGLLKDATVPGGGWSSLLSVLGIRLGCWMAGYVVPLSGTVSWIGPIRFALRNVGPVSASPGIEATAGEDADNGDALPNTPMEEIPPPYADGPDATLAGDGSPPVEHCTFDPRESNLRALDSTLLGTDSAPS